MPKKHQQPTRGVPDIHCDENGESGTLRRAQPLTRKEKMAKGEEEAAEKRAENRATRRGNATVPSRRKAGGGPVVATDSENEERAENRAERRGQHPQQGGKRRHSPQRGGVASEENEARAKSGNKEAHRHQNRSFSKEDDPGDAVWSKIEKRKAKRAAAKERRRTGRLNKNQRRDEKNRKEKTLNLKDMRVPIDNIMQNDAGDMVVAIPEEYHTEEVLTQMKEHFASKHPNGTVEETRDEEGNVTGLHWAKDEEEPETLLTTDGKEVTLEVQAATEEEAVAKIQERLQELTGDPELAFESPVNRREPEAEKEEPWQPSEETHYQDYPGGPIKPKSFYAGPGDGVAVGSDMKGSNEAFQQKQEKKQKKKEEKPKVPKVPKKPVLRLVEKSSQTLPPRPSKAALEAFIGQLNLTGDKEGKLQELLKPIRGYDRNPKLVEWAKCRADYRCEVEGCTTELFVKPDGTRYVEVHHILTQREAKEEDWDVPENVTCLCSNHHRELHYGENRDQLREQLQSLRAGEQDGSNICNNVS